jgi:S-adenosylmethionine hydrolase
MKIITFLTDFGTKSGYPSQMKGVILKITEAKLIDITHEISPQNINEGAYVLSTTAPYFPKGTIHIAVVDPGVGTNRKGIIIKTKSQILIGPDNGLLIPTAHQIGDFTVYEITNKKYNLNKISNTFHGRDIFAPVAAHIINGIQIEEIGPKINNYIDLNFNYIKLKEKKTKGHIIYIDKFGNIITNIYGSELKKIYNCNKKINIKIANKKYILPFIRSYNYVKKGEYLLTINSNNLLEISKNQENAAKKLKIKIGDEIKIFGN